MTPQAQMRVLNLYKGQSIKKAEYALQVANTYCENSKLALRLKLNNLRLGE